MAIGSRCSLIQRVICRGPAGVWVGTLILVLVTFVLWLAGPILSAISVGVSRGRAGGSAFGMRGAPGEQAVS
jgi:hypothetical protein